VFDDGTDEYKIIMLNKRYLSFRVIKVFFYFGELGLITWRDYFALEYYFFEYNLANCCN